MKVHEQGLPISHEEHIENKEDKRIEDMRRSYHNEGSSTFLCVRDQ